MTLIIERKIEMKKYFSMKTMLSGLFIVFGMFLFAGCAHLGGENSETLNVTSEQVHQVEPMELKEAAEEEEVVVSGKNEPAPASLEISLEQCRAWALENNLDLRAQLIAPAIAAERVSQEEANFESTFSAYAVYSKTNQPSPMTLDITGNKVDNTYADLGVDIPLRTGGDIKLDLIDNSVKTNSIYSIMNPYYDPKLSASISQPLLRNAGKRVNEHAIRIAEHNAQIIDARTKLKAIYLIADIDRYYWKLYATRRLLEVRKQQYELAKALYDETETLVKVGTKAEIELVRTKAGVADKLEAIITAENNVKNIERYLKQMLNRTGLEVETSTELIPTTEPDPVHYEIKGQEMTAKAIENRMDLLELELQLAQDNDYISYYKNQTLPSVTLGYTYNMNGLGATRNDSYDMLKDNDFHDHRVTMGISIPIGNEAAKSRLRQATYGRAQRLASRDAKKGQIKSDVLNQIDTLEANWQRILAARQTTILYDEQYKAEKRRYELGMQTSTDVFNTQTNLADAQQNEISALTDYQISLVDLAYATGTLLGSAKVQWEPYLPKE
jgi:outer membrane protein